MEGKENFIDWYLLLSNIRIDPSCVRFIFCCFKRRLVSAKEDDNVSESIMVMVEHLVAKARAEEPRDEDSDIVRLSDSSSGRDDEGGCCSSFVFGRDSK